MLVKCLNCGKKIRRSWKYSETHDCFCSYQCHNRYMGMRRKVVGEAGEQHRISRQLLREIEMFNETYGG